MATVTIPQGMTDFGTLSFNATGDTLRGVEPGTVEITNGLDFPGASVTSLASIELGPRFAQRFASAWIVVVTGEFRFLGLTPELTLDGDQASVYWRPGAASSQLTLGGSGNELTGVLNAAAGRVIVAEGMDFGGSAQLVVGPGAYCRVDDDTAGTDVVVDAYVAPGGVLEIKRGFTTIRNQGRVIHDLGSRTPGTIENAGVIEYVSGSGLTVDQYDKGVIDETKLEADVTSTVNLFGEGMVKENKGVSVNTKTENDKGGTLKKE